MGGPECPPLATGEVAGLLPGGTYSGREDTEGDIARGPSCDEDAAVLAPR